MKTLVGNVLYGFDDDVSAWVARRIPGGYRLTGEEKALGIARDGELVGGVIYSDWNGVNVLCSIVIEESGRAALNRSALFHLFSYPFTTLGCEAITVMVAKSNLASLNLAMKMGFEAEAIVRLSAYDGGDLIILKMFRDRCRWIGHGKQGQQQQDAGGS